MLKTQQLNNTNVNHYDRLIAALLDSTDSLENQRQAVEKTNPSLRKKIDTASFQSKVGRAYRSSLTKLSKALRPVLAVEKSFLKNYISGGNKCGHQPYLIKTDIKADHLEYKPNYPLIIKLSYKRLETFAYDPHSFTYLGNINDSSRQMRSEGRESFIKTFKVICSLMDIKTGRVGIPKANGFFWNFAQETLAKKGNLSVSRFKRVLKKALKHGLIRVEYDKGCKTKALVVTHRFWMTLGLLNEYKKAKKYKNKLARKQAIEDKKTHLNNVSYLDHEEITPTEDRTNIEFQCSNELQLTRLE